MGRHTEAYRLLVTDHVRGREGVASDFTGWADDPEAAIAAYRAALLEQEDGTTVDLQRVETTSLMSADTAATGNTLVRYANKPSRIPPLLTETGAAPVSPHAADGDASVVSLSPGMARMLVTARQSENTVWVGGNTGTSTALIDRGLLGTVDRRTEPHRLTERGRRMADRLHSRVDLDVWIRTGSGLKSITVPDA